MDLRVAGDAGEAFAACLCDQHAIEGVAVKAWEATGNCGMFGGDGQVSEPRVDGAGDDVGGNG